MECPLDFYLDKHMLTSFSKICAAKVAFQNFLQDQLRALDMIKTDPELARLSVVEAPLFDAEIRGVPALKFMGNMIWK